MIKKLFIPFIAIAVLLSSCSEEGKPKRKRVDVKEIKPSLNLSAEQELKFDAVVEKYNKAKEASRNIEGIDRATRFAKYRELVKKQNAEILAILNIEQQLVYEEFSKKLVRGRSGYNEDLIAKINTELALDSLQSKMLVAVNNTFEKSYVNAHDYYHGNGEAAREYWNKFDEERKKALQTVFSQEQYAKYLDIVNEYGFRGEHKSGGKSEVKTK